MVYDFAKLFRPHGVNKNYKIIMFQKNLLASPRIRPKISSKLGSNPARFTTLVQHVPHDGFSSLKLTVVHNLVEYKTE